MKTKYQGAGWITVAVVAVVAVVFVATAVAVSFRSFHEIEEAATASKHTFEVLNLAGDLLSALKDAESGGRGYLLTGDETFLKPYLAVRDSVGGQLIELRQRSSITAAQSSLNAVGPLIDAKLTHLSLSIESYRNQSPAAAQAIVRSGEGQRLMDSIRAEMSRFIQIQEGALVQRNTAFQSDMRRMFTTIIASSVLWIFFATAFVYWVYRQAQQRLKKTEGLQASQYARSLIEASLDPLVTISPEGKITDVNAGSVKVTGVPREKLIGTDFSDYFTEHDKAREGYQQVFAKGFVTDYPLTIRHEDGHLTDVLYNASVYKDVQGNVLGVFAAARDVTESKRLDQVLQETNVELGNAKLAAEKSNLAKSDFLSSMSHELRTPLNAILGFAQLMESGSPLPTPTQKASLDQILQAGWYLLELINEILDLALIESGKLSLSLEPMSLPDVLLDCQAMIEPQAQKSGIRMVFPVLDGPYFANADRTRVKQVLINLLSNAIKYNRVEGSVEVTCNAITAERIRISVRDTGEGLSPEKLTQLFQPFNRLGQEASAEEGTGIGLVVSKRLVELMGGEIGAESIVGVGSVFWIELISVAVPQLAAHADEPLALLQARVPHGAALRTLLYVEDNRANMQLVEQLIARRPDMRLLSAGDGMRGITLARIHQPDVILMDINLPGISGIQALKILREDPVTAHIPVLAISANAIPSDIKKGLEAGFFRYLTKPIKVNEFMQALDMALELTETELNGKACVGAVVSGSCDD